MCLLCAFVKCSWQIMRARGPYQSGCHVNFVVFSCRCLQFLISPQCVYPSFKASSSVWRKFHGSLFSFSYFLKVDLTAFPSIPPLLFFHLRSHNRSHPMLTPIHSCFFSCFCSVPSLTFSHTAGHSFLCPPALAHTLSWSKWIFKFIFLCL